MVWLRRCENFRVTTPQVYAIPLHDEFRGITVRHGVLLRGDAGWGEFCAFEDYSDAESLPWLRCAEEAAGQGWPAPQREWVPVNCTVPVVAPERAREIAASSGARTAKVKVADSCDDLAADAARVEAVRDALGPSGAIRVDANAAWDVDTAVAAIRALDKVAGGLEYVEQPCGTVEELVAVRKRLDVPIAADESIRRAEDPLRVALAGAADVAVIKVAPLGGVRRALAVAEECGLPCVVSSAVETSVGMAAGLALAGALPELWHACGLGTLSLLDGDVCAQPLTSKNGWLPVPRQPPEPDPAPLECFRADEETSARWLARLERVRALG
jgi:O-succinylbenzoate synthase